MSKEDLAWLKFREAMNDKRNVREIERLLDRTWSHPGWKEYKSRRKR